MADLSRPLNKLLAKWLRVQLVRTNIRLAWELVPYRRTRPLCVELIGASGVGKTTLYAHLLANRGQRWLTPFELVKKKKPVIGNRYIPQDHLPLIEQKFEAMRASGLNAWDRLKLYRFFSDLIRQDIHIQIANTDATVLLEDGILNLFHQELSALEQNNPGAFNRIMAHRAVIHCQATAEETLARIRKRQAETGQVRVQHQVATWEALAPLLEEELTRLRTFTRLLRTKGTPVLDLCTTDDLERNIRQVNAFIDDL